MNSVYRAFLVVLFAPLLAMVAVHSRVAWADGMIQYNRDIRPILTENCFACHGPDANHRAADLRLDQREDAIAGGAIVANKPEESEMIRRIFSTDPELVMPTPESHKTLTEQQKELIKAWITEGAEYQGHWAFLPIKKPELPQVRNASWVRNALDRFTLSELERQGLEPSPEAELRALVRRVCYDLTGLPPTTEEMDRVLADPSPERYENYVEELLKRPEWGEHRGRYWLDYARYADTHGIHFDNYREMWSYREWVINAFNRNMPFDQFTIEQLAGDLLPNADLDQRIATGFNRCNITTNEGGAISEEYNVLYTRDRVETTGQVWLGLTVGCAVCHDHKFDPISQQEFYQLAAFFNNTTQAAMDGNIKDTPPIVSVPLQQDRARFAELDPLMAQAAQAIAARREAAKPAFSEMLTKGEELDRILWQNIRASESLETHIPLATNDAKNISLIHQGQWRQLPTVKDATLVSGHVADVAWQVNEAFPEFPVGDLERSDAFSVSLWVKPGNDAQGGALIARMDESDQHRGWDIWMEGGAIGMHLVHKWPENAAKAVSRARLTSTKWQHVVISYDGSSKAEGIKIRIDGNEAATSITSNTLTETIRTKVPFSVGKRSSGATTVTAQIQDVRIYKKVLAADELKEIGHLTRLQYLLAKPNRNAEEQESLFAWFLETRDEEHKNLSAALNALQSEKVQITQRGTIAHIMNEAPTPPKAFVLMRGDYDKRSTEVVPSTPKVLPPMSADMPLNRLGFAQWLLLPENPLTTRVTVNRFWQEIHGNGLVGSTGDFGVTGQMPTHPDLLDYLAVGFREDGWNVKNFFRTLVTSSTYRQSASVSPEKLAMDPSNKWMARGTRFRMDAEMIRDTALAASSLLVNKIGGPSVRPYMPPGVWEAVAMPGSNTRDYVEDQGEGLYRRSIYTFLKRSAPPPNMDVFNATAREVCTVKRERTNTPLQALVTLNDTQFVESARVLAEKVLIDGSIATDANSRIQTIANRLIARSFRAEELEVVNASLLELLQFYNQAPDQAQTLVGIGRSKANSGLNASELAAWTMLVNQLMNLDEVLTK